MEKLWRWTSQVAHLDGDLSLVDFRFENPVPIYADGKVVGFACVHVDNKQVWAECAVDYAIPQRLDVENGIKHWTLPHVTLREWVQIQKAGSPDAPRLIPTIADLERIELRKDCDRTDLFEIGVWL